MNFSLLKLQNFSDARGDLVVFLKGSELSTRSKKFGQIYLVMFNKKGVIRGNHYHKKWREWFGITTGRVLVKLEDVTTKEQVTLTLDAKKDFGTRLEVGPGVAHTFTCLSKYAALLNYADKEWNASDRVEYSIT